MNQLNIIPFFVIIPLISAFLISLFGRLIKGFSEALTCFSFALLFIISLGITFYLKITNTAALVYKIGGWIPPFGICMVIDNLATFILVIVNLISLLVAIYSVRYIDKYTDKPKFFTLFSLMVCGMNGVLTTGDLFNLFVFLEMASIASYALVAFSTEAEGLEASFKYTIIGSVASSFIFLGIAFLYGFTSTLNMADISRVISAQHNVWIVSFVSVLFLVGFGLKSALVPFHAWLPDAYTAAPASISAIFSGGLIKALGIYSLVRILFNCLGMNKTYLTIFMFMGALSILVAVILALSQWNFKRLLAYHSISQIGYMFLGFGLGTPMGIIGGLFHLFNHSIFKPLLFLNAGAVEYAANTTDLKETSGLAKVLPVTWQTSLIASMSISGLPPFNGFFSKLIIIFACVQRGFIGYAVCAIIGSILTLASFLKVQKFAFWGELKDKFKNIKEVPGLMKFSMIILALICIFGWMMILPPMNFFILDAAKVLLKGTMYSRIVLEAAAR